VFEDLTFVEDQGSGQDVNLDLVSADCILVVDDVTGGPHAALPGAGTLDIQGSCTGASFCP
jgi:hypothetical protein